MTEKTILGIDPGTNVMGYGLLHVRGNKAELVVMGVVDMRRESDPYVRLGRIYERVASIIDAYHPDELAIEAPFFGKNVQSMLKLGRAQGVAIAAAIRQGVPIHEYAPLKIKMGHPLATGPHQGAGGSDVATPPFATRRPKAPFHGRHRRAGGSLLPLPADGKARDGGETL